MSISSLEQLIRMVWVVVCFILSQMMAVQKMMTYHFFFWAIMFQVISVHAILQMVQQQLHQQQHQHQPQSQKHHEQQHQHQQQHRQRPHKNGYQLAMTAGRNAVKKAGFAKPV